ncbi:TetR/AcrR family transcriptional regulator [Paenibacillus sp. CF384]|uniref:TetR/AcrR family transcriptional regulator n=1 Tax=Paenibacillus sp. CF384 TaxID=1884382 RepID=UPI00089BD606|nr:helix-turn-helix domain-containing protein [Paenibacillus sp. CF384]SDX49155.1 transcriptional regulator, TetR family [Paenibacillus sp. CF384]
MVDERLRSIYFHAGRLFNTKRYANTKVSEIAVAAGIATGTIYNLFASKKAILTFVIRASLEKDYLDSEIALPVEEADMKHLYNLCEKLNERVFGEVLRITDVDGAIIKSFTQMVADIFDMSADILLATGNIETNASILRELANSFFPARDEFFRVFEHNLNLYMAAGEIRKLDYPRVHVQSINDILTWWAMNANIAMPEISVPRAAAREIAVDLVARAYSTPKK